MAKPIGATPVLTGKEAETFLDNIHKNSKKRVTQVPTPKLEEAHRLIKKHGKSR